MQVQKVRAISAEAARQAAKNYTMADYMYGWDKNGIKHWLYIYMW